MSEDPLLYALGGGHGHTLRGLAILRRLGRGRVIAPPRLRDWADRLGVATLPTPERPTPEWAASLAAPRLLLVDTFPRGVLGELPPLLERAPAWLIARRVRPDLYLHPPIRKAIETRFERLLWCEEPPAELADLQLPQQRVGPILLEPEPLSREAARTELGIAAHARLLIGLGSGPPRRQAGLCRLLARLARRFDGEVLFVSTELPAGGPVRPLFPAGRYLRAADAVVGAAGYHAAHETLLAGVPTLLIPQARPHDDQAWRAAGRPVARSPEEVLAWLASLREGDRPAQVRFPDGAAEVAALVERRMQAGVLGEEQIAARA